MSRRIQYIVDHADDRLLDAALRDARLCSLIIKFDRHNASDCHDVIVTVVTRLATADPTTNHKYLQWLVNKYIQRDFLLEDAERIAEELRQFERVKPQLAEKDINRYKSVRDLYVAVQQLSSQPAVKSNREQERSYEQQLFDSDQAVLIYRSDTMTVVQPLTQEASRHFGRGTRWCTAATTTINHFDSYHNRGPLYIVMGAAGKFQFHFSSKMFMDSMDTPVDMGTLIRKTPELKQAFDVIATKVGYLPLVITVTPQLLTNAIKHIIELDRSLVGIRDLLSTVDPAAQNEEIALLVASNANNSAYIYVRPDLMRLPSVQRQRVMRDPGTFPSFPVEHQDACTALLVVTKLPVMLKYVRPDLITEDMCCRALANQPTALIHVPTHLLTDRVVQTAVDKLPRFTKHDLPKLIRDPRIKEKWRRRLLLIDET
jgi:hypothetical protein